MDLNITFGLVMAWIVFGIAGFYVFKNGKRRENRYHSILGIALMVYPYFVSTALWNWIIGIALMGGVYLTRFE